MFQHLLERCNLNRKIFHSTGESIDNNNIYYQLHLLLNPTIVPIKLKLIKKFKKQGALGRVYQLLCLHAPL